MRFKDLLNSVPAEHRKVLRAKLKEYTQECHFSGWVCGVGDAANYASEIEARKNRKSTIGNAIMQYARTAQLSHEVNEVA